MIKNDYDKMYAEIADKPSWKYIDPLGLKLNEIEEFCSKMELNVEKKSNVKRVEEKMQVPIMATHFYYYIYHYKKIPTQREFMKFYTNSNQKWVEKNINTIELKKALIGRLSRTYPSLLRDIHFYHVLKESGKFENVLYNLKYDLQGKVDIYIKHEGISYGLQLRTKTKNSDKYYKKKPNRGSIDPRAVLIDLPISLDDAFEVKTKKQSLKLYGEKQIEQVLNEILKIHNKKKTG